METLEPLIIDDIKRVATKLGRRELSCSEYVQHGGFSEYQIYDGGRTWEEYCRAVGIVTKRKNHVTDEIYFSRLKEAIQKLGRLPKTRERKRFSLNFSQRRYPTLNDFIEEAVRRKVIEPPPHHSTKITPREKIPRPIPDIAHDNVSSPLPNAKRTTPPIPTRTNRKKWERASVEGFPYAPEDESGVVALFAILCHQRKIDWQILELRSGKGIDATCYDHETQREIRVELKHTLSRAGWNHRFEDVDYVVCWENRWHDFPKPVIVLRDILKK